VLVATGEVSFDPSTRSQYLTLNPPAGCAYICNCAVDPAWRRRGVASALMRALEEAAAIAGGEGRGAPAAGPRPRHAWGFWRCRWPAGQRFLTLPLGGLSPPQPGTLAWRPTTELGP
jgi:GNAT superfamily N-acetyltransferase